MSVGELRPLKTCVTTLRYFFLVFGPFSVRLLRGLTAVVETGVRLGKRCNSSHKIFCVYTSSMSIRLLGKYRRVTKQWSLQNKATGRSGTQ